MRVISIIALVIILFATSCYEVVKSEPLPLIEVDGSYYQVTYQNSYTDNVSAYMTMYVLMDDELIELKYSFNSINLIVDNNLEIPYVIIYTDHQLSLQDNTSPRRVVLYTPDKYLNQ